MAQSGNASNWNWSCDFVSEHTYLKNYRTLDEKVKKPGEDAIFCRTQVVSPNLVKIIWSINASKEIVYPTDDKSTEHMLAIEFMGTYNE